MITQTILHSDPERPGNCFAACVATALDRPLRDVPHFVEWGQHLYNGHQKDDEDPDRKLWWAMFLGYVFALGLIPELVDGPGDAGPGELVFVAGLSPRGVMHQVLYRDGELFHDPHPSRAGLVSVEECFVLTRLPEAGHDPRTDGGPRMIRRLRRWLAPRTHRVVAGHRGAIWDCRLCPAGGWECNGPQAYDAAARHLADAHETVEVRS